jgi:uncharacterized glyoxalase superfamily protein PhnB
MTTTTTGIQAVFLTTHSWGKAARFFRSLGYDLELETDHQSGQLRNGNGPYVFIAEVPEDETTEMQLVLHVPDAASLALDADVEVVSGFTPTHWGTQQMIVRDPDGRTWSLEAPASS